VSIQTWFEDLVKAAVDEAVQEATDSIVAELQAAERNLLAQLALLPGLVGAQIGNVAVDTGAIASKVIAALGGQLAALPQQIIQGVLGGLNPFKGGH
jgi:hypothetical protein